MLLTTLQQQIDPAITALLIVDMQNDFVADDGKMAGFGLDVKPIQAAVPTMNRVIEEARKAGVLIVWIKTTHSFKDALPNYIVGGIARLKDRAFTESDFIVQEGSWGAEYFPQMTPRVAGDFEVVKNFYSGFTNTILNTYLKAKGIKTIVSIGTMTNVCVMSTALQGWFEGYYSLILSDAAANNDPYLHDATLKNHRTFFGYTPSSAEVIAIWNQYGDKDAEACAGAAVSARS